MSKKNNGGQKGGQNQEQKGGQDQGRREQSQNNG